MLIIKCKAYTISHAWTSVIVKLKVKYRFFSANMLLYYILQKNRIKKICIYDQVFFLTSPFQFSCGLSQNPTSSSVAVLPKIFVLSFLPCSSPCFCMTSLITCCSHLDYGLPVCLFSFSFKLTILFWILSLFILKKISYHIILSFINLSSKIFIL